jgi:hypothetical protein
MRTVRFGQQLLRHHRRRHSLRRRKRAAAAHDPYLAERVGSLTRHRQSVHAEEQRGAKQMTKVVTDSALRCSPPIVRVESGGGQHKRFWIAQH